MITAAESVRVARTRDPEAIGWLLAPGQPLEPLLDAATALREEGHGRRVAYSPALSFPLTPLDRHACGHCAFAPPRPPGAPVYLPMEQVLDRAHLAAAMGCREALLTLGDKPERRCPAAVGELRALGLGTTVEYLAHVAGRVLRDTGLLPHADPGVLGREELAALRTVSASQSLLLETVSTRQLDRDEASRGGADERPEARLATIQLAGELHVPFTTGLLLGAGGTLDERAGTIAVLAELVQQEHVQALVVQRSRTKAGTRTPAAPGPGLEELLRTAAVLRLAAGPHANVQASPDLGLADFGLLLRAGVNDWGAVLTVLAAADGPEAGWPQLGQLGAATRAAGCQLVARLCVYPEYVRDFDRVRRWYHPNVLRHVLAASDGEGLARQGGWWPTALRPAPTSYAPALIRPDVRAVLGRAEDGQTLEEAEVELLFRARGEETAALARLADDVRGEVSGDLVTYVVNHEVSYADVCCARCRHRAPGGTGESQGPPARPRPTTLDEVVEEARGAAAEGATELRLLGPGVLLGGADRGCTGDCSVELCSAVKAALPEVHLHAFSPLEVHRGAATAGRTVPGQLALLKRAGLGSLRGTAAEVLDDRVRRRLCPEELTTEQWVEVVADAHRQGLPTTSTIVFGSLEGPESWARHLVVLRELQIQTGGITEFVPLPFAHLRAPNFGRRRGRQGPTWEEVVKMHAVARLALRGWIDDIQVSWAQLGPGCAEILRAGANDVGGTLMGGPGAGVGGTGHGPGARARRMRELIRSVGRTPAERTALYAIRRVFAPDREPRSG